MTKRKYTHVQELEGEILAMRKEGATRQEIADRLGLSKSQIKNWINRYNRKQAKLEAGIVPRPKGRPRKDAVPGDVVREQAYEIERLRMENKLLGIFCDLQEGSEAECKICSNPPA